MKNNSFKSFFILLIILTLQTSCQPDRTDQRSNEGEGNDNVSPNTEQETPEKMIESLVGEWKVDRILQGEQNVTANEGGTNQTLTFTNEARYILRSGNGKIDSGAFRMNEQLKNLYLESESNEQTKEWEVSFESESMVLTPREGTNGQEKIRYIYSRTSGQTNR